MSELPPSASAPAGREPEGSAQVDGVVTELLPSQLSRVELPGPHVITAHLAETLRRNFVRVLVGDRVRVEIMPTDRTRGRIVKKL